MLFRKALSEQVQTETTNDTEVKDKKEKKLYRIA
jgi:hypothetical protein